MICASDDDLKLLIAKRFLLTFDSGVVVIKHWKIHNYLQNDRVKETTYLEEKNTLTLDGKKAYVEKDGIHDVYKMDTKCIHRIEEISIGMDKKERDINISKESDKDNEQLFDMFWESYPRKDCKQNAKKKFLSIKNLNKKFDLIMFALNEEKQKEQWKTPQYIPMAQTWLNQERWVDYEDTINQPKNKPLNEIKQEQQTSSFDEKDFFQANLDA